MHCQGCHGANGKGLAGVVPGFGAELAQIMQTSGGREYLVRVPGVSMAPITDAQLAQVLNWMVDRYLPGLTPNYPAFTEQEISDLRHPPMDRPLVIRQQLLAQENK